MNPNIVNVSTINGGTVANTPSTANATTLLNNPASSGQIYKINSLFITNVYNATANCAIAYNNSANGAGTSYPIANNLPVPLGTSVVLLDKSTSIYLLENNSITITSQTAANSLSYVVSYDVIS